MTVALIPVACAPCDHAAAEGWWGRDTLPKDNDAHCRDCHISWPGSNRWGHCSVCHLMFSGTTAFDRHQMWAGCPNPTEDVETALRAASAHDRGRKKRYIQEMTHERGWSYWGWNNDR